MPGARLKNVRSGDSAELLAEFILESMAFTTKVPRQEDIGYDLFCVLAEHDQKMLKAGPFFTVQVKSKRGKINYEKEHEVYWIKNQENPLFICVANCRSLSIDLYSTWNMLIGILAKDARKIILSPGGKDDVFEEPQTKDDRSEQLIPLGKPILHITAKDVMDEAQIRTFGDILREWILMDRENIVNRYAGMDWVTGPRHWETNKPLATANELISATFWNAKNLDKCRINFGRCATALRLTTRWAYSPEQEKSPELSSEIEALETVLKVNTKYLEPLAKEALHAFVEFNII
jgi:hypothetical protein